MAGIKITNFLGTAPKISPELLPDTAAQVADNCKLYSGDIIPYPQPAVVDTVQNSSGISTLYALRNPTTGEKIWLSWSQDVDVAVLATEGSAEQRFYYSGDGVPKVSNYRLATGDAGAESSFTPTYSRASNIAKMFTGFSNPHGYNTGDTITVSNFGDRVGTYVYDGVSTVTITIPNYGVDTGHGLVTGTTVPIKFFPNGSNLADGDYAVTVTSPTVFTVTVTNAPPAASGNMSIDLSSFNKTAQCTVVNAYEFTYPCDGFDINPSLVSAGSVIRVAFSGTALLPITYYDLGLPVPPEDSKLTVVPLSGTATPDLVIASYSRSGNVTTITTTTAHNLTTGNSVNLTNFTYRMGTFRRISMFTIFISVPSVNGDGGHGLPVGTNPVINVKFFTSTPNNMDGVYASYVLDASTIAIVLNGTTPASHTSGDVGIDISSFNATGAVCTVTGATTFTYPNAGFNIGTVSGGAGDLTGTSDASVSYARDAGGIVTIVLGKPHGFRTGTFINVSGFTYRAATYTQSGNVITVALTAHGYKRGGVLPLDFTSGSATDGTYIIDSVSANAFTVLTPTSATTSGFVNIDMRGFNARNVECTVVNDTTVQYFSPGFEVSTVPYIGAVVTLGGLTQNRTYVYTWVTPWSEESIASKPSADLNIREGITTVVSNIPTIGPAGNYFVRGVRLYRILATASGTDYFRLATLWFPTAVKTVSRDTGIAQVSFVYPHNLSVDDRFKIDYCSEVSFNIEGGVVGAVVDPYTIEYTQAGSDVSATSVTSGMVYYDVSENPPTTAARYWGYGSNYDFRDDFDSRNLFDTLGTDEYDPPPEDLTGLTLIQNNVLCGFVGNTLYFSEPSVPHAWPGSYALPLEHDIVGIAPLSGSAVVLTKGYPYLISGTDPANGMVPSRIDANFPCLSKRSIVPMGYGIVYATHDGLAVYSANSGPAIVTKALFNNDTWKTPIDPTTIVAEYYGENYLASHSTGGFVFEQDTRTGGFFVNIDTRFTAAYYDTIDGTVYYTFAPVVGSGLGEYRYVRVRAVSNWGGDKLIVTRLALYDTLTTPRDNIAVGGVPFATYGDPASIFDGSAPWSMDMSVGSVVGYELTGVDSEPLEIKLLSLGVDGIKQFVVEASPDGVAYEQVGNGTAQYIPNTYPLLDTPDYDLLNYIPVSGTIKSYGSSTDGTYIYITSTSVSTSFSYAGSVSYTTRKYDKTGTLISTTNGTWAGVDTSVMTGASSTTVFMVANTSNYWVLRVTKNNLSYHYVHRDNTYVFSYLEADTTLFTFSANVLKVDNNYYVMRQATDVVFGFSQVDIAMYIPVEATSNVGPYTLTFTGYTATWAAISFFVSAAMLPIPSFVAWMGKASGISYDPVLERICLTLINSVIVFFDKDNMNFIKAVGPIPSDAAYQLEYNAASFYNGIGAIPANSVGDVGYGALNVPGYILSYSIYNPPLLPFPPTSFMSDPVTGDILIQEYPTPEYDFTINYEIKRYGIDGTLLATTPGTYTPAWGGGQWVPIDNTLNWLAMTDYATGTAFFEGNTFKFAVPYVLAVIYETFLVVGNDVYICLGGTGVILKYTVPNIPATLMAPTASITNADIYNACVAAGFTPPSTDMMATTNTGRVVSYDYGLDCLWVRGFGGITKLDRNLQFLGGYQPSNDLLGAMGMAGIGCYNGICLVPDYNNTFDVHIRNYNVSTGSLPQTLATITTATNNNSYSALVGYFDGPYAYYKDTMYSLAIQSPGNVFSVRDYNVDNGATPTGIAHFIGLSAAPVDPIFAIYKAPSLSVGNGWAYYNGLLVSLSGVDEDGVPYGFTGTGLYSLAIPALYDATVYEWDDLDQPKFIQTWKSKVFKPAQMLNFGAARVIADYTGLTKVWGVDTLLWSQEPMTWGASNGVTFSLWVDKELLFETQVSDSQPFRLPSGYRSDTFEVGITSDVRIRAIHLAETVTGLREV